MKKVLTLVLILFVLTATSMASAHEIEKPIRFGLGAVVGYPGVGLSTNTFLLDQMSLQANVYAFYNFKGAALDLDWLFWLHEIVNHKDFDFTWYAGPGAGFYFIDTGVAGGFGGSSGFAGFVKGSVGLALQFKAVPMDLTFQVSPGVQFGGYGAAFWGSGTFATRYYF